MDTTVFRELGFTEAEIALYFSLLKLGKATTGRLIEDTSLQSSVVHRVIKQLVTKGLASYVIEGNVRNYQPAPPKHTLTFLETKRAELNQLLPDLEALYQQQPERQEAAFYQGRRAIFSMLQDLIVDGTPGEEYLSFSLIDPHEIDDVVRFYKQYNIQRRERGLDVKVLVNKRVRDLFEAHYDETLLRKARVRYSDFEFPQGIVIFQDQVVFLSWGERPIAVRVQSEQTAEQYRTFFHMFYDAETNAY